MIIYEVNLAINRQVAAEYLEWLQPHIAELLALDGFLSARLFKVESDPSTEESWCVQYHLKDREALQAYLDNKAATMRAEAVQRFGDQFRASRRIMLHVSDHAQHRETSE